VYTPIKQKTKWNILIGAIPGALPPVGGWIAANGTITSQTFAIFCFLFFWQIPHFFSIAWLYKVDYKKAGFKMFMTDKDDIFRSNILLIGFSILTLVFSLLLISSPIISMTLIITTATITMGLLYVFTALKMALKRSPINARRLLFVSIIYIPVMLIIVIAGI
jgi:protoheme IX farnesyltransferase